MTLNGVVAVILRYFSEIGSIRGALRKSSWRYSQIFYDRMYSKASSFSDISRWYDVGTPPSGGLNARGIAKYSDFGRIEGYISETVQDRK